MVWGVESSFIVAPTFVFVLQRLCLKLMFYTPLYLFLSVCVCVYRGG